uniref:Uncharacterized protein n=1 Tax=Oryza sativa subsp. japonica TaxID=39947 RepID=Q8H2Q1_ORYSJ|nr:hypothetical protein [Oryza sativa Japonica Group]
MPRKIRKPHRPSQGPSKLHHAHPCLDASARVKLHYKPSSCPCWLVEKAQPLTSSKGKGAPIGGPHTSAGLGEGARWTRSTAAWRHRGPRPREWSTGGQSTGAAERRRTTTAARGRTATTGDDTGGAGRHAESGGKSGEGMLTKRNGTEGRRDGGGAPRGGTAIAVQRCSASGNRRTAIGRIWGTWRES